MKALYTKASAVVEAWLDDTDWDCGRLEVAVDALAKELDAIDSAALADDLAESRERADALSDQEER